jgi:hypothetical protein
VCRDPVEKSQVACFDVVLVYSVSAGTGNQAIILDERCSVMPLKCLCFGLSYEGWAHREAMKVTTEGNKAMKELKQNERAK